MEDTPQGIPPVLRVIERLLDTALFFLINLEINLQAPRIIGGVANALGGQAAREEMLTRLDVGEPNVALFLSTTILTTIAIHVLFEQLNGATPAKYLFGFTVVNMDGSNVDLKGSLARAVLFYADVFIIGLISMQKGPYYQRLGDIVGNTLVIQRGDQRRFDNRASLPKFVLAFVLAVLINFVMQMLNYAAILFL